MRMIATSTSTGRANWVYRTGLTLAVTALCSVAMQGAHGATSAVAVVQPARPAADAAMVTAMAHYRQGKTSAAYFEFAKLADQGNVEAARIALTMLRYGGTMYGTEWGSSQPRIDLWTRLASQPGEPMASESGE